MSTMTLVCPTVGNAMLIRLGYELVFDVVAPTPMNLMLYVHPSRSKDLQHPETIDLAPNLAIEQAIDTFGNRIGRIIAPPGELRITYDNLIEDWGEPDLQNPDAKQIPVSQLPADVLQYLMSSRYCEVDKLSAIAWSMFGKHSPGWERVQAVTDWVFANVEFGYQYANNQKTAWDVWMTRQGVCRDFMHIAITLLRGLNIPCRYATGYLGDIGVEADPAPMDFSAYFEVYLDHEWYSVDARHNVARLGRIKMAHGRDATDVALTTSFGPTTLKRFKVVTDLVKMPT